MQIGFFIAYLVVVIVILVKSIVTDVKCEEATLTCAGMYLVMQTFLDTLPDSTRKEMEKTLENIKEEAIGRKTNRDGGAK